MVSKLLCFCSKSNNNSIYEKFEKEPSRSTTSPRKVAYKADFCCSNKIISDLKVNNHHKLSSKFDEINEKAKTKEKSKIKLLKYSFSLKRNKSANDTKRGEYDEQDSFLLDYKNNDYYKNAFNNIKVNSNDFKKIFRMNSEIKQKKV